MFVIIIYKDICDKFIFRYRIKYNNVIIRYNNKYNSRIVKWQSLSSIVIWEGKFIMEQIIVLFPARHIAFKCENL